MLINGFSRVGIIILYEKLDDIEMLIEVNDDDRESENDNTNEWNE